MRPVRDPRLRVMSDEPFNAETPLDEQVGTITPNELHYVRNHSGVPRWDGLAVDGAVERPLALGLDDLTAMTTRSLVVTLECAGNGRAFLDPPVPGEQWRLGAVGTAEWTGVPLRDVLDRARLAARAVEVVFAGADVAEAKGPNPRANGAAAGPERWRRIAFERSLPVARALDADVLLAFAMNGEPLPADHGAPLRLVVPGAYGVASVKWLARITAVDRPFRGFYQAERYVIEGEPLPPIAPRAVITFPREGAILGGGPVVISGYCWSAAPVAAVEVSTDGGATWSGAEIDAAVSPHAWRRWRFPWMPTGPGDATLIARAVTGSGERQPLSPVRSALGYANNAAQAVNVRVGAAT